MGSGWEGWIAGELHGREEVKATGQGAGGTNSWKDTLECKRGECLCTLLVQNTHAPPEMFGEYICYMKFRWEFHEMHSQRGHSHMYPIIPDSTSEYHLATPWSARHIVWERSVMVQMRGWNFWRWRGAGREGWGQCNFHAQFTPFSVKLIFIHNIEGHLPNCPIQMYHIQLYRPQSPYSAPYDLLLTLWVLHGAPIRNFSTLHPNFTFQEGATIWPNSWWILICIQNFCWCLRIHWRFGTFTKERLPEIKQS